MLCARPRPLLLFLLILRAAVQRHFFACTRVQLKIALQHQLEETFGATLVGRVGKHYLFAAVLAYDLSHVLQNLLQLGRVVLEIHLVGLEEAQVCGVQQLRHDVDVRQSLFRLSLYGSQLAGRVIYLLYGVQ